MKNRPFGVTLISIIIIIEGILQILAALALFGMSTVGIFASPYTGVAAALMLIGIVALIIGIVELVVAAGMWSMEGWTWVLTVIICWIDIVFDVINALVNVQTFGAVLLSLIIPVVVLIYFYQPGVRKAFGR